MPKLTVRKLIAELMRSPNIDAPVVILDQRRNVQIPIDVINATGTQAVELEMSGED